MTTPADPLTAEWQEALIATLRRDDLCDETDGEHHSDDYVASFLIALDTEMQARTALAAPAADAGYVYSGLVWLDVAAEDVRYAPGMHLPDYWRGYNAGIGKLAARLAEDYPTVRLGESAP